MSICKDCFHSYVCEQFNEHRECDNKRCHFANDHFVPADLINRLEARIGIYETCNARKDEAIKHLEAENERLMGSVMTYKVRWAKATSRLDKAKAEAYKECIEKVKALFPSDNEPYQYWEIHEGADNISKELVGEDNDR
jgi:hypothetical protein